MKQNTAQQISANRKLQSELREQISDLRARVRDRAKVVALVEAALAAWSESAQRRMDLEILKAASGRPITPFVLPDRLNGIDLGAMLVGVVGAGVLRDSFMARIDAKMPGMSEGERDQRAADLTAQLDALERDEERLICASEAAGAPIQRRPDARPEIVLGVE
jgi:hypothetical protein